jgi:hypothetical protein
MASLPKKRHRTTVTEPEGAFMNKRPKVERRIFRLARQDKYESILTYLRASCVGKQDKYTDDGWELPQEVCVLSDKVFAQAAAGLRRVGYSWDDLRQFMRENNFAVPMKKTEKIRQEWERPNMLKMQCYHSYQRMGVEWPIVRYAGRHPQNLPRNTRRAQAERTQEFRIVRHSFLKKLIKNLRDEGNTKHEIVQALNAEMIDYRHGNLVKERWSEHKLSAFCNKRGIHFKRGRPRKNSTQQPIEVKAKKKSSKRKTKNGINKEAKLILASVSKKELAGIIKGLSNFATLTIVTVKD